MLICNIFIQRKLVNYISLSRKLTCEEGNSLLSPPGKMERRRTFLFFSSGAIGSGLEAWFTDEESRELLFILKGGAGGFSSISTLSDIFSSTHNVLRERKKEIEEFRVKKSANKSAGMDEGTLRRLQIPFRCTKHNNLYFSLVLSPSKHTKLVYINGKTDKYKFIIGWFLNALVSTKVNCKQSQLIDWQLCGCCLAPENITFIAAFLWWKPYSTTM